MKKILIPTDFSEASFASIQIGVKLARYIDAWVYLLHVKSETSKETSKALITRLNDVKRDSIFNGLNLSVLIEEKYTGTPIVDVAETHGVDLIVMGARGKSTDRQGLFIGNNTKRVIGYSEKVPVLLVKERDEDFYPNNIVFASNFFGEVDKPFQHIKMFAELFDANLHLVSIVTPKEFVSSKVMLKKMNDFARNQCLKNFKIHIWNHQKIDEGIVEFAKELDADVISLVTHKREGFSKILHGSIFDEIGDQLQVPVISIKVAQQSTIKRVIFPE